MDVIAALGPARPGAQTNAAADAARAARHVAGQGTDQVRRASGDAAAAAVAAGTLPAVGGRAVERTKPEHLIPSEVQAEKDFGTQEGEEEGVLKFDVADADVLARFAIHEETNRVIVTMYQRDTGEVIKEFPPRQVLDVMAALAGRGLAIDVST